MSMSPPHLPVELIEHIMDEVSAPQENRLLLPLAQQLSCLALVARRCRNRVNSHRFALVVFHRNCSPARIHGLVSLLNENIWEKHERLAHHITTIFLSLAANRRDRNYFPHCFEDGSMATLLRLVFRGDGHPASSKGFYSLTLWMLLPPSPDTESKGINFATLGPDVAEALHDLCSNSYMTELRLSYFFNVPKTLLESSHITHLFLQNVHFSPVEIGPPKLVVANPPLQKLKSLSIKSSSTFINAIEITSDNLTILPALTEFNLTLKDEHDFQLLSSIGKQLIILQLDIDGGKYIVIRIVYTF